MKALITGITGQDGSYLAEMLLDHLYPDLHESDVKMTWHYGDMTDATNLIRIVQEVQPVEIYNLAAQSHVQVSFESPEYTANSDALIKEAGYQTFDFHE